MPIVQRIIVLAVAVFLLTLPPIYAQSDAGSTPEEKQALLQELVDREQIAANEGASEGVVPTAADDLMEEKEQDRAGRMSREEQAVEEGPRIWGRY